MRCLARNISFDLILPAADYPQKLTRVYYVAVDLWELYLANDEDPIDIKHDTFVRLNTELE